MFVLSNLAYYIIQLKSNINCFKMPLKYNVFFKSLIANSYTCISVKNMRAVEFEGNQEQHSLQNIRKIGRLGIQTKVVNFSFNSAAVSLCVNWAHTINVFQWLIQRARFSFFNSLKLYIQSIFTVSCLIIVFHSRMFFSSSFKTKCLKCSTKKPCQKYIKIR